MRRILMLTSVGLLFLVGSARAADDLPPATVPATQPARLPNLEVDLENKCVLMECEAVNAPAPLEFLVCAAGSSEHEAVLRSRAKASHLHMALLMLGLEAGQPFRIVQPGDRPVSPTGPSLRITCRFTKDGKDFLIPAHRLMRNLKTKKPLPPLTFVFAGSRLMRDGRYAADVTGHLISVVNFEYSVIDLPDLRSSANESLEWEIDPDVVPPRNTPVWVIIEPADNKPDLPPR